MLAYSGGLDTSIILKWLQDTYGCEVITFTADLGQGEELEPARAKAEQMGVKQVGAVYPHVQPTPYTVTTAYFAFHEYFTISDRRPIVRIAGPSRRKTPRTPPRT